MNRGRADEIKGVIESFKQYITEKISDEDKQRFAGRMIKQVILRDDEIEVFTLWDLDKKPETPSKDIGSGDSSRSRVRGYCNLNPGQDEGWKYDIHKEFSMFMAK